MDSAISAAQAQRNMDGKREAWPSEMRPVWNPAMIAWSEWKGECRPNDALPQVLRTGMGS
jgi:hypothetical protein